MDGGRGRRTAALQRAPEGRAGVRRAPGGDGGAAEGLAGARVRSPGARDAAAPRGPAPARRAVIAIDGPAGAGKSTIARLVAARLGYLYVDTGAMYRAVALAALRAAVDARDREALAGLAASAEVDLRPGRDGEPRVWLDGQDVTASIRQPAVDQVVPVVAGAPEVRALLVEEQRRLASGGGVVVDGRDIGSVVLPRADHKFFVTADLDVRVRRRLAQLRAKGFRVSPSEVERDIVERDDLDAPRTRRAPDAVLVDTTRLTVDEAVGRILAECARAEPAER